MDQGLELLEYGLDQISLEFSHTQKELLLEHLRLVLEKNKQLNLTTIDSLEEGIFLHIIDSLLCAEHIRALGNELSILDLGTGGGFPGIPLSIALDAHVTLIDSINKKVAAVQEFIEALGIGKTCTALCTRSEDLARTNPSSFDVVVARAVAQTNILVEYASPLLCMGGSLCAMKAHITDDELAHSAAAAELCGMAIVSRETTELPQNYGHREIIYMEKIAEPKIKLPRRNGMATKRPLGL